MQPIDQILAQKPSVTACYFTLYRRDSSGKRVALHDKVLPLKKDSLLPPTPPGTYEIEYLSFQHKPIPTETPATVQITGSHSTNPKRGAAEEQLGLEDQELSVSDLADIGPEWLRIAAKAAGEPDGGGAEGEPAETDGDGDGVGDREAGEPTAALGRYDPAQAKWELHREKVLDIRQHRSQRDSTFQLIAQKETQKLASAAAQGDELVRAMAVHGQAQRNVAEMTRMVMGHFAEKDAETRALRQESLEMLHFNRLHQEMFMESYARMKVRDQTPPPPPPPPPDYVPLGVAAINMVGRLFTAFAPPRGLGRSRRRRREFDTDSKAGARLPREDKPASDESKARTAVDQAAQQPHKDAERTNRPASNERSDILRSVLSAMVGNGDPEEVTRILLEEGITPEGLKKMLDRMNDAIPQRGSTNEQ